MVGCGVLSNMATSVINRGNMLSNHVAVVVAVGSSGRLLVSGLYKNHTWL